MVANLQLEHVTGGYSLNKPVLHDVSFDMQPGEIVGLIGLNGAGKSTTMKHILGLLKPHSGTIRIKGKRIDEQLEQYRSAYAYVPENPLLYDELTVQDHLRLTAMAYGVDEASYNVRVHMLLEQFQMEDKLLQLPQHLSKGMRQKVMVMNAFLADPELYFIDEPFLGLDPLGIRSLLEQLVLRRKQGASILMSSHILSTMELYCDRFIVLHGGKIRASGTLQQLCDEVGESSQRLEQLFFKLVASETNV